MKAKKPSLPRHIHSNRANEFLKRRMRRRRRALAYFLELKRVKNSVLYPNRPDKIF